MLVAGLLLATVPSGAASEQELSITSSIKLGRPFFGDTIGPFVAGDDLTLVCSGDASPGRSLSWWEDEERLEASSAVSGGLTSSSLVLGTVRPTFSGRRLACRDEAAELEKLVVLQVQADQGSLDQSLSETALEDMARNGESEPVQDDIVMVELQASANQQELAEVIQKIEGEPLNINCIQQGYNPSPLSWWEDDTELEAQVSKSPYATSSLLTFDALSVGDTGRTFTCRAEGASGGSTVRVEVYAAELDITSNIQLGRPIFGDNIGPFLAGDDLMLTCSIQAPSTAALSWFEGEAELEAVTGQSGGFSTSSLVLGPVVQEDSGRQFVCREKRTGLHKVAIVGVEVSGERSQGNTDGQEQQIMPKDSKMIRQLQEKKNASVTVEILKCGFDENGVDVIRQYNGEPLSINCVMQGYNPSPLSWWEGEEELPSEASKSLYATSSSIVIGTLRAGDDGRSFSCRTLEGDTGRTVLIAVIDSVEVNGTTEAQSTSDISGPQHFPIVWEGCSGIGCGVTKMDSNSLRSCQSEKCLF